MKKKEVLSDVTFVPAYAGKVKSIPLNGPVVALSVLSMEDMDSKIHGSILCDAACGIHEDTLIIIDPTDVQKTYAKKMPYLAKVWDGSRGRVGDNLGYTLCMAIACENGCRKIVPLMLRLWSSVHPEYVSENDEVESIVSFLRTLTGEYNGTLLTSENEYGMVFTHDDHDHDHDHGHGEEEED